MNMLTNSRIKELYDQCDVPPEGWKCTREKGHEGPCAAVPLNGIIEDIEGTLKLKEDVVVLRNAIFCVLEGFTLPHDARKILESVLWRD